MGINKLSYYINEAKKINPKFHDKKIRIAFIGSFTLNGFEETIRVQCDEEKISCITYNAPYNQINQEILSVNSKLYEFNPDIIFILFDEQEKLEEFYFSNENSKKNIENIVEEKYKEIENLVDIISKKIPSKIVITNLAIPTYSSFGIFESKMEFSFKDIIISLNQKMKKLSRKYESVYVFDFNSFVTRFGEKNVADYKKIFAADARISFDIIPHLVYEFMGYVKPILGKNKKCIVLDLDNTLWGGIIGEDGFEGIKLGPYPNGRSFLEFQRVLKLLSKRGIILAVNSKNNSEDALKVIREHPHMILKENDFACLKINWNDKISNMKEISRELNIGLDSIVFFDDDPTNREIIKMSIPEIKVVDLPEDSSKFVSILKNLNEFNQLTITTDDLLRTKMYKQELERQNFESTTQNLEEYLKKLDINVKVKFADEFSIPRISQLILKTNQFNLTTKRYQLEDIQKFSSDDTMIVGCAEVKDKFGESGITNSFIIQKKSEEWILDTFLLSCRVMGRGIEDAIVGKIIEMAKKENIKKIIAEFIPTQKNKPAENFLADVGFKKEGTRWVFSIDTPIKIPEHLTVRFNE